MFLELQFSSVFLKLIVFPLVLFLAVSGIPSISDVLGIPSVPWCSQYSWRFATFLTFPELISFLIPRIYGELLFLLLLTFSVFRCAPMFQLTIA